MKLNSISVHVQNLHAVSSCISSLMCWTAWFSVPVPKSGLDKCVACWRSGSCIPAVIVQAFKLSLTGWNVVFASGPHTFPLLSAPRTFSSFFSSLQIEKRNGSTLFLLPAALTLTVFTLCPRHIYQGLGLGYRGNPAHVSHLWEGDWIR